MPASVEIRNVKKTFAVREHSGAWWQKLAGPGQNQTSFTALDGFSASVKKGSFTTIFGPNGSGKSTLFRIIAGLEVPTAGSVHIDGKPPAEARVGFVFQNYRDSMLTWRSALGNVQLALEARGLPRAQQTNVAMSYLERVNMAHIANKPFYELSGGQAQLVSIARAFAYQPDILLMDEPFSALDFETTLGMMETLATLWHTTKITTLFISHNVDEAVYLGDSVMVLTKNPGRVQATVLVSLKRPRPIGVLQDAAFFKVRASVLAEFKKGAAG